MNDKKGFTLVELLAVIAILGIVLGFGIPSLLNVLKEGKEKALLKQQEIMIAAARNYMIDYKLALPTSISVDILCNGEYLSCPIVNPVDNTNMTGYIDVDTNKNYSYSTNASNYVNLTVNLNSGNTNQIFETRYKVGSVISLIRPMRSEYNFTGWTVSGTGASINGTVIKTLTIGTSNVTLTANWIPPISLTVNLNGGIGQTFKPTYTSGEKITLIAPSLTGYIFTGWTINSESGSSIKQNDETLLIIGNRSTILTANWGKNAVLEINDLYNLAAENNGLFKDSTVDENIRYTGGSPNNYVRFNDELWRIIGIFKVSNGRVIEERVKLIRDESIGNYSWDSSAGTGTAGYGINDWKTSELNILLNNKYYNRRALQVCYNAENYGSISCSFVNIGISEEADKLIDDTIWTLGGIVWGTGGSAKELLTLIQYTAERGTTVYSGRSITYPARIGLLFPSDYGYASTDALCRENLNAGLTSVNSVYDYSEVKCKNNNWLFKGYSYWTISHRLDNAYRTFSIRDTGTVEYDVAANPLAVHPVVYLKSNVVIINGRGTINDPYQLSL